MKKGVFVFLLTRSTKKVCVLNIPVYVKFGTETGIFVPFVPVYVNIGTERVISMPFIP
ncbi:hypothetical protein GCM10008967_22750 [Bacillus carboniphilus]|uniref:Uncharacterized protein n=1 Tax=Bacillus carboniphilus TaxID=86663 RepID=A0ABN0WBD0_9BACI